MGKKSKLIQEATSFIEDWKSGKSCKFKPGDIVEKGDTIGEVQFGLAEVGKYQMKWWIGPKPWDFIDGSGDERYMKKTDKPNPMIYKYSDMIPGPSSIEIDKLNEKIWAADALKYKNRTGKQVDAYINALEEEIVYKKEMKKLDDKEKDKVVADDEDEDVMPMVAEIDPVIEKREKIISED